MDIHALKRQGMTISEIARRTDPDHHADRQPDRRIARGFRNRENYRLRMLLIGDGLTHPHLR